MSTETPTVEAQLRDRTGTRYARRLRNAGLLPAVIYGHKEDPVPVSVNAKEMLRHLHHGAHVLEVKLDGGKTETCLVKDLQFGYLGDNVIHIDLTRVNLDEEVHVQVHLHFVGEPVATKEPGAILAHDLTELEVICKVNAIPDDIRVDQSQMESSLTVGEIELPPGVRAAVDPDTLIAHISFVQELETGEEADVTEEGGAEPEVISESKEGEEESTD